MATLEQVQGSSFVPDASSSLNLLLKTFGTGPERAEKQRQADLLAQQQGLVDIIAAPEGQAPSQLQQAVTGIAQAFPGGAAVPDATQAPGTSTAAQKQAALVRMSALNPKATAEIRATLERGDKVAEAQLKKEVAEGVRLATLVGSKTSFEGKRKELMNIAKLKAANGQDFTRALELANMAPEKLDLALRSMKILGADTETLLKPTTEIQQLRNIEGKTIGQQTVETDPITGQERVTKVEASPLVTKPGTEAAKINADLAAGNITPEQATQQRKNLADKQKTSLIKSVEAIGIDVTTPEGKKIVLTALNKPRIVIKENEGLFKLPLGFMLADPNDPTKGVVPIPGGPKDNLTGETAGKAQMLLTAKKAAKGLPNFVFVLDKNGKPTDEIDRTNLINAQFNTPGTRGREMRSKMEFGIQAITRIETGAAMPQEELQNTRTRFMPTVFDSPQIVKLKLEMFNDFIGGTLKLLDPTGRFNAERFQAELETRQEGVTTPAPAQTIGRFTVEVE